MNAFVLFDAQILIPYEKGKPNVTNKLKQQSELPKKFTKFTYLQNF